MSEQKPRRILTPCPPKKRCPICEARLNEVFGSADHSAKYGHQAANNAALGLKAIGNGDIEKGIALLVRSASYANLVLGPVA